LLIEAVHVADPALGMVALSIVKATFTPDGLIERFDKSFTPSRDEIAYRPRFRGAMCLLLDAIGLV
jgi:hypothetical protein